MLISTLLRYILALAILITLVATLLYVTKAIKAKDNKSEKADYCKKAGLFFVVYAVLNLLRLYLERAPQ